VVNIIGKGMVVYDSLLFMDPLGSRSHAPGELQWFPW